MTTETIKRTATTAEGWTVEEIVEVGMGFNGSDYVHRTIYVPAAIFDTWNDVQDGETGYMMNESRTYVRSQ